MNVLVIGGNGFIGSHLVDKLLKEGNNVRVFDITYERYRKPLPEVDYRIASIDNIPELYEALLGIDIVFHLASLSVPSTSNIDTVYDVNGNLIPTLNILNLLVKLKIPRIIYFSSGGAVYGNPVTLPIIEDHPLNPISSYGIVKLTIEKYLFLYQRIHGIQPLIIRPSNPYGPRQGHFLAQGVISTFLKKILKNEQIRVFGDGNSTKDYIFIEDLINICYSLSFKSKVNGVYNLGSGKGTSLNQIIELIETITGNKTDVIYEDVQNYDVNNFVLDITKISNVLGDYSFTTLEKGLTETWNWINNLD
jgi:UDP-glucose 4-epimerase